MQFRERGHGVWGAGEVGLGGCRCLHACTVHICFISFLSWGGATTTRRAVLVTTTVSPKRAAGRFDQGLAHKIALVAPGMCVVSAACGTSIVRNKIKNWRTTRMQLLGSLNSEFNLVISTNLVPFATRMQLLGSLNSCRITHSCRHMYPPPELT
jgi:hypothetical protein